MNQTDRSAFAAFIMKVTRRCNLRCSYCLDWRSGGETTMPFPVLARLTASALRRFGGVQFVWHGGEPTLLPMDYYAKALAVQARFRRPGQIVQNALQTNGTLVDETWARFFRENRFSIGISIDGPQEVHDRTRVRVGGQGSFSSALRGLRLLQNEEVPVGVLTVIDEEILHLGADRLFDFFLELGARQYGCLAVQPEHTPDAKPGTSTQHYTDSRQMTEFMSRLYDRWLDHGDPGLHIRELDTLRQRVAGETPGMCTLAGGCFGRYFAAEANGDISHCDTFPGDPDYTYGNIMEQSLSEMLGGPLLVKLCADNDLAVSKMRQCPEFRVCSGGCPHDRYISVRHNPHHTESCCGMRELIEHVRMRKPEVERMLGLAGANARNGREAESTPEVLPV